MHILVLIPLNIKIPKNVSLSTHILYRIYNSRHDNQPIGYSTTAHFTLHISILQLHKL